ncbi:MAG: DUF4421 family protein [Bdellovibrionales bacterium]
MSRVWSAEAPPTPPELFQPIQHRWSVAGVLDFPIYSFYLGAPDVNGVAYVPNFAPRLGPKVTYKDFGAMVTFGLPLPGVEKKRRGQSSLTSVVFGSYWRGDALDIYYQNIKGFYVASPFTELSFNKPERYPQLPDARVLNFGLNWYHVKNPRQYSLKAAFDLSEKQLKSGGSWVYNPFYNHLEISVGNEFIPGIDNDALVELPNLASARSDTVGMTMGYGQTWIHQRLFASALGGLGPALQYQQFSRADGNNTQKLGFSAKLNINLSAGWNSEDYFLGGKFLLDTLWSQISDVQVWSSLINFQVVFGRRF